jgi:transposase
MNPDQGRFDNLLAECDSLNGESPEEHPETEKIEYERRKKSDKRNGRVKIPDHLERVEKIIDLPEAEKICPVTGLPMIRIGEEISEQLAYEPGRIYAIRYIRPKYVSPDRRNGNGVGVKTAPLPDGPIDRCKADVSLLAHIIISKFCDHLPLHRQHGMFARHGIELPESTMGDWTRNIANTLEPLYNFHRNTILASDYVNADDTPVLFVSKKGKSKRKGKKKGQKAAGAVKGHIWAYLCRINAPPDETGKSKEYKN